MLNKLKETLKQGLKNDFDNFNEERAKTLFEVITSFVFMLIILSCLIVLIATDIAKGGIHINDLFAFITLFVIIVMMLFAAEIMDITLDAFYEFLIKKHLSDYPKAEDGQGIGQKDEKLP